MEIPPEHLLFLPCEVNDDGSVAIPGFEVPATAQTWSDIARFNRNDGPLDDVTVYEDILDAEVIE